MKELVSVIIPFYNEEQYIGDCLISLIKRSEEHTSELQSHHELVCRLLVKNMI